MPVSDMFEAVLYYGAISTFVGSLVRKREYVLNLILIWGICVILWTSALLAVYTGAWLAAPLVCSLGNCDSAALGEWGSAGIRPTMDDYMSSIKEVSLCYIGAYCGWRVVEAARPFSQRLHTIVAIT